MKTCVIISAFLIFCSYTNAQQSPKIEKGVSEILANHRKKIVNDIHYNLSLNIPANKKEKIDGIEIISFELKKDSTPLQIDFKENEDHLYEIIINDRKANIVLENEHIIIAPKYLRNGKNFIKINFTAGDLSLNRNNDYLYTLLVPDRARTVFPCFDQPNLKARFEFTLTVPQQWQVLSNAPLLETTSKNDRKVCVFKESDLFSTYLFSFVAGKFTVATKEVLGKPMQFFYRETDSNKIRLSVDTVFGLHAAAINYLEDYTQIKFPFQKLDFASIPDFQYGGMEHVGAIDYKASSLFLDSGSTQDQQNARSNVVSHETSHMWFGDLVTMQWFNDVWMKEVFANFMADKITQGNQSSQTYELKFLLTHLPRAYAVDRTAGANPIRQNLPNLQEAGNLYGAIIYDKAPVMMRQLERLMGVEKFRDGLREYLKKYSFSNATWPDLIKILDDRTPADLQAWNKVWVNTPGRPVFNYSLQQKNNSITKLTITQKGERSTHYLLPQFFEIALVYNDHVDEIPVNMNKQTVTVKEVEGKKLPSYILFNSSGEGYGLFPVDEAFDEFRMVTSSFNFNNTVITQLQNPVMRASAYITFYENMLSGKIFTPKELLHFYRKILREEKEELNLNLIAGHINDIYWRLISPSERNYISYDVETDLWNAMQNETTSGKKKILFRAYQSIALSKTALDNLYQIWKEQKPPAGVKLSEDEYVSLALNLVVKDYPDTNILTIQLNRTTNPDRKQRLQFIMPAVSNDVKVRDAFFASLKDPVVRKKEAWVTDALNYLHHPLRTNTSIKYLKESLDMLQQVQMTGDIFFPGSWLNASFGSYQTKEAADIVRNFLKEHPHYNAQLKMKILQAADPLFRAEKLVK